MTIQDFHINLDIEVDKTLDYEYPYISAEQKDYWLNKAQNEVISDVLVPDDQRVKSFEETQDKLEDIRTLIKESGTLSPATIGTTYVTTLPADYMYRLRHRCDTASSCGTKNVGGIFTKQLYINNMLKDPFWRPSADEPIYYMIGNTIKYETLGAFAVTGTQLTYIKQPVKMRLGTEYINPTSNIECELPEYAHNKVLARAVSMILENIESQRYQTNLNELNKIE